MKKLSFVILCFFAGCFQAGAQSLHVFDIDTTGFPILKAKFYAFDKEENKIKNLSPADFILTENGQVRVITRISCPATPPIEQVSISMSIDISGSMAYANGINAIPVELGKTTATNIVKSFSLPPNEIAIQTCNDRALINIDFSTNRQRLLEIISPITAGGNNDFVEHLLNTETGLLNVAKKGRYKRAAILYTDAWWYALSPDQLKRCIDTCTKYDIRFFAAIYSRPEAEPDGIKKSLRELAEATGGRLYDGVVSMKEAEALANELQGLITDDAPCLMEWQSSAPCVVNTKVNFSIPHLNLSSVKDYRLSEQSIATLEMIPSSGIRLGDVSSFKDTTLIITARNSQIEILNISMSEPSFSVIDFGGTLPPFMLQNGESRVLTIRFTKTDSMRIFSKLTIQTSICAPSYSYFSTKSPTKTDNTKTLNLIQPNGGEAFVVGSDTAIAWTGVLSEDAVKIDYSTDKGQKWTEITQNGTSLKQNWRIPNRVSDNCLIRIESFSLDTGAIEWTKTVMVDRGFNYPAYSIKVDERGSSYVFGRFEPPGVDFGNGIILSSTLRTVDFGAVNHDLFIAKYNSKGEVLWAKKIESNEYNFGDGGLLSSTNMLTLDDVGHLYVSSYYSDSVSFGSRTFKNSSNKYFDTFIAKYDTSGAFIWANNITGTGNDVAKSVKTDKKGYIYIGGISRSPTIATGDKSLELTSSGYEAGFIIKFNPDGNAIWGKCYSGNMSRRHTVTSVAVDGWNNVIISGTYTVGLELENGVTLPADYIDGFLLKYSENGTIIWGKRANSSKAEDFLSNVQVDATGKIYCTGWVSTGNTPVDFGNGIIFDGSKSFSYIGKFDQNGEVLSIDSIPGLIGEGWHYNYSVSEEGNIFLYGLFRDSVSFGNTVKLYGNTERTGYLAFFNSNGDVEWAKLLNNCDLINGAIDYNLSGDVYLCGYSYKSPLLISRFTPGSEENQSDTSDAVFSIVKPIAISYDVNMGRALVTSSKDSVIQSFISNTGSYPIRIDAVNITGSHASDFQLVSGIAPFTIAVGDKKSVEIRFRPSVAGSRIANLAIITQADTLIHNITGEGVKPIIQAASTQIDFGIKEVGLIKDTVIKAVLKNIGDAPLTITQVQMLGPDKEQFEIISGSGSFTLDVGAIHEMKLRFAPKYIGRTSGQIGFNYDGMLGHPEVVKLFGEGIEKTDSTKETDSTEEIGSIRVGIYIMSDSAYIGETCEIKLMRGTVKPVGTAGIQATSFRAQLMYSNAILAPVQSALVKDAIVKKGITDDTLTITQQWNSTSNELTRIPMIATLGDRISTDINLIGFDWLNDKGEILKYDIERQSGVFTVLGICPEGGVRLFDAAGKAQMMVSPHPVNGSAELTFTTSEKGKTVITLTDVLGRQKELADIEYLPGEHSLELNTTDLTSGIYILTMQTSTQVFTQQIVIER